MIRKNNLIAQIDVSNLDFYFGLEAGVYVYVRDLKHQAFKLINEAEKRQDIKIYNGNAKRKTKKIKWIQHFTFGISSPTTMEIKFSNGVIMLDYGNFDKESLATEEEMMELIEILDRYGNKMTGCKIIASVLPSSVASIPKPASIEGIVDDYYYMLGDALHGGANLVMNYDLIPYETHIDYHQLYASVMITHQFPYLSPEIKEGYFPHEFGIYEIAHGRAKLKKDGFAILPCWGLKTLDTAMFGASGEWSDLTILGSICEPDLKLLYENYEVEDLFITRTLYYPMSFSGKNNFNDIVYKIYNERHKTSGAVKNFWKLMNEVVAGYFERTILKGNGWWSVMNKPESKEKETLCYNPIVGIFITAYGRQQLNALLHLFPHDKVAGYDTDCVFFEGKPEEIPEEVVAKFGDGLGELHFDGIYKDVIHKASKVYHGYDLELQRPFQKAAGVSKTGKFWSWNLETKEYEIKEVLKDVK